MNGGETKTEYVKGESFRTTYSRLNTDIGGQEKRALAALARPDAASALPAGAAERVGCRPFGLGVTELCVRDLCVQGR